MKDYSMTNFRSWSIIIIFQKLRSLMKLFFKHKETCFFFLRVFYHLRTPYIKNEAYTKPCLHNRFVLVSLLVQAPEFMTYIFETPCIKL